MIWLDGIETTAHMNFINCYRTENDGQAAVNVTRTNMQIFDVHKISYIILRLKIDQSTVFVRRKC